MVIYSVRRHSFRHLLKCFVHLMNEIKELMLNLSATAAAAPAEAAAVVRNRVPDSSRTVRMLSPSFRCKNKRKMRSRIPMAVCRFRHSARGRERGEWYATNTSLFHCLAVFCAINTKKEEKRKKLNSLRSSFCLRRFLRRAYHKANRTFTLPHFIIALRAYVPF